MKYYAIRIGRENNKVVKTWGECSDLVMGFPGAIFQSFKSYQHDEAKAFSADHGKTTKIPRPEKPFKSKKYAEPKPHQVCLVRGMYEGRRRCLVRFWAMTIGEDYEPNDSTDIPWK